MRVTMIGCGASGGVPLVGCDCKVCRSDNPKNKRMRSSIYIEINKLKLLVDTSPDLHKQAIEYHIRQVDAVLFTHDHADHIHGIDELRSFNYLRDASIPVYADEASMARIRERFSYAFGPKPEGPWYRPSLIAHPLPNQPIYSFNIQDVEIIIFEQIHGKTKSLGVRIGDFAYSTDVNELPKTAISALAGVDTWIVDCLRYRDTPSHATLEKTLGWISEVKPKLAVLTHMAHDFDYDTLAAKLPSGVTPGHDGMVLEI